MVNESQIIQAVKPEIEKFSRKLTSLLQVELEAIFREEVTGALKEEYLKEYDKLTQITEGLTPSRIKGIDPLSLASQRHLFESHLSSELAKASFSDSQFNFNVDLAIRDSGVGTPTKPTSLLYYLMGVPDNHGFITKEHKKLKNPVSTASLGRLGQGFMITESSYRRERWASRTGITFAEVRHPISGFQGYKGFDDVPGRLDYELYLSKALDRVTTILNDS